MGKSLEGTVAGNVYLNRQQARKEDAPTRVSVRRWPEVVMWPFSRPPTSLRVCLSGLIVVTEPP